MPGPNKTGLFLTLLCVSIFQSAAAAQNNLALTPSTGWNRWNHFANRIDDKTVRSTADALVATGLKEAGYVDDNVHSVETMRFAVYHGESGNHAPHPVRRRWDYFVQYLLGVTPPNHFEIKEDRQALAGNGRRR